MGTTAGHPSPKQIILGPMAAKALRRSSARLRFFDLGGT